MGAVVCYDCTDPESLRNAETWLKNFKEKAKPDAPKVLVSCKRDKYDELKHPSPDEGRELAMKFQCTYIECSAYSGDNVQTVFEQLAGEILEARYAAVGMTAGQNKNDKAKQGKGSLRSL